MRPLSSFVGQPIRSLQTMLRVIAEDDPTHLRIVPDGIYGPETRRHGRQLSESIPRLSCALMPPNRWMSFSTPVRSSAGAKAAPTSIWCSPC